MANASQHKTYSFFELLSHGGYRVVIPIIQRDYAQGRINEKTDEVRSEFLKELHKYTLDLGHSHNLDFVYGTSQGHEPSKKFIPLDGQQRLTTLFLLHWYLAQRCPESAAAKETAKMLRTSDNGLVESDFTYLTRLSSTDFCNELVKLLDKPLDFSNLFVKKKQKGKQVIEVPSIELTIKDMNWYSPFWDNDPTIQSMLVMLDAIHKEFGEEDHGAILGGLIDSDNPTVTFIFMDLDEYNLTDDLYIKMNSRGKPLTAFENFKAKLEQYISTIQDDEVYGDFNKALKEAFDAKRSTIKDIKQYFSFNIDTRWTNLFWVYARRELLEMDEKEHELALENHLDRKMSNFIRVIFTAEYPTTAREMGRSAQLPSILTDETREDISFNQYKDNNVLSPKAIKYLIDALDVISGREDGAPLLLPGFREYDESGIYDKIFMIKSEGQRWVRKLEYVDRVRFHAYIKFLIAFGTDKIDGLKDWMLFVYNITHAPNLTDQLTKDNFGTYAISISNIIEKMAKENVSSITELLTATPFDSDFGISSVKYQIQEEIVKAHLKKKAGNHWSEAIAKYEAHEYFTGQIGFLLDMSGILGYFTDNGNCDWSDEDDKSYFEAFTAYSDIASEIFAGGYDSRKYAVDALLERAMLCVYPKYINLNWDNLLLSTQNSYNIRRDNSWKRKLHIDENKKYREGLKILFDMIKDQQYLPVEDKLRPILEDIIKNNQPTDRNLAVIANNPTVIKQSYYGFFSTYENLLILHSGKTFGRGDVEAHTYDIWDTTIWPDKKEGYAFEYKKPNCVREGDNPHIETWISAGEDSWLTLSLYALTDEKDNNKPNFYLNASTEDLECDGDQLKELNSALSELGFDFFDEEDNLNSYYEFDDDNYKSVKKGYYQLIDDIQQLINDIVNTDEQPTE